MRFKVLAAAIAALLSISPATAEARGLRGSPESMREQHAVAVERDLTFIDDAAKMRQLVEDGGLDVLGGNSDYAVKSVSYPYALPEVRLFIERLAKQYRAANGAQLVVTSLARPSSEQPRNAHKLSVHPAGMAVDFRVPQDTKSRAWLESTLLQLENSGVLDVTRERYPPHYHVAVFPEAYAAYVEPLIAREKREALAEAALVEQKKVEQPGVSIVSAAPAADEPSSRPMLLLVALTGLIVALALVTRHATAQRTR